MEIAITGKPNVGKSTFFSAATMAPAEIASYPFTTIKPNRGIAYVRAKCPHLEFGVECNPNNAPCKNGTRLVPVEMLDLAGLVPDAHEVRGLGNKFLDDLRQASALIHIVDASGGTDFDGNLCKIGEHDPLLDVKFLPVEISYWILSIIMRGWEKIARQAELEGANITKMLHERLTGLAITEAQIHLTVKDSYLPEGPRSWTREDLLRLSRNIQIRGKPMIIAANKCDIAPEENLKRLSGVEGHVVVPTSAEYELALRRASKSNLIDHVVGSNDFRILDEAKLSGQQLKALNRIRDFLKRFESTGVQKCLEEAVYKVLNLVVVYPVEDENKWTDKNGNVLPDAYLLPRGSNARDLAYKVHTDLGDNFIRGIDARSKRVIGQDHEVKDGDVIKIVARI